MINMCKIKTKQNISQWVSFILLIDEVQLNKTKQKSEP